MDPMDIDSVAERVQQYEQEGNSLNEAIDMALSDVKEKLGIPE